MSRHLELVRKAKKYFPALFKRALPRKVIVIEVSGRESSRIRRRYLQKNKPTNVLSFRYGPNYGEILICPAVIRREAGEQGNTYKYQMTWMILHGMIHLAGIHHENSSGLVRRVERLEHRTLKRLSQQKLKI